MSLALYMDVHVPAAITRGLRRRSVEVLTAQEDGTATLTISLSLVPSRGDMMQNCDPQVSPFNRIFPTGTAAVRALVIFRAAIILPA